MPITADRTATIDDESAKTGAQPQVLHQMERLDSFLGNAERIKEELFARLENVRRTEPPVVGSENAPEKELVSLAADLKAFCSRLARINADLARLQELLEN